MCFSSLKEYFGFFEVGFCEVLMSIRCLTNSRQASERSLFGGSILPQQQEKAKSYSEQGHQKIQFLLDSNSTQT